MPTLRGAGRNSRRGISPRRVGLRLTPDELATCDGQLLTWAPKKRSWASRRWCSAQAPDRQDDERRRDRGRRCAAARRRLALLVGCRRAVRSHFDGDKPKEKLFLRTAGDPRLRSRCLRAVATRQKRATRCPRAWYDQSQAIEGLTSARRAARARRNPARAARAGAASTGGRRRANGSARTRRLSTRSDPGREVARRTPCRRYRTCGQPVNRRAGRAGVPDRPRRGRGAT